MESVLEKVRKLECVQFRYNDEIDPQNKLRGGFIAQQVAEVFPDAVFKHDGILKVDVSYLKAKVNEAQDEYRLLKKYEGR